MADTFWGTAGSLLTGGGATWSDLNTSFTTEMKSMGPILGISGAINGAIGSYYALQTQMNQLKSQSMSMEFKAEMDKINARQAEVNAQGIMFAGERQGANIGLRAGQVKAKARSSMAAHGIQLGEGNAAEVIASTDLMKEVDMLTVNANTVRAAEAARTQSVNYSNAALLEGVSASNLMTSANSISPFMGAYSSMLGSATTLANAWYQDRKLSAIAGRLGLEQ